MPFFAGISHHWKVALTPLNQPYIMHYFQTNGTQIPALGLGTYLIDESIAKDIVSQALAMGYRQVDTAQWYNNEEGVGSGIKAADVARQDIFLTTKVNPDNCDPARFIPSVQESLRKLQTDYVDLLLIHWPHQTLPLEAYLSKLMEVQQMGLTRHIGVSNFPAALVQQSLDLGAKLITNQVEYHPYLNQDILLNHHRAHQMSLTAYCPIAQGRAVHDPILKEIGAGYGKTGVQVCLRWFMQQASVMAIPKSSNPKNLASNMDIFDFELSAADMATITGLQKPDGRIVNPDFAPVWD